MKIKNEKLLAIYRTSGNCEWCGKSCVRREPHHIFSRGAGGPDLDINLIALGSTPAFCCACHTLIEAGNITRYEVLEYVSRREKTTPAAIESVIDMIRRLPKDASQARIRDEIGTLDDEDAIVLTVDELTKAGVIQ